MTLLFDNVTIAAESDQFTVTTPTTVTVNGLSSSSTNGTFREETIVVEIQNPDEVTYQALNYNQPILLSRRLNTIIIAAPGVYRITKEATTLPVSAGYIS